MIDLNVAEKIVCEMPPHPALSPESGGEGKGEGVFSGVGRNHRECSLCFIMQNLS